jgi:hypothetical protein
VCDTCELDFGEGVPIDQALDPNFKPKSPTQIPYNLYEHGSEYDPTDFEVPIEVNEIAEEHTKAAQTLSKQFEAEASSVMPTSEDGFYDFAEGKGFNILSSAHPEQDHGSANGGGAPSELVRLHARLGLGKSTWVDMYRAMKNAPEHPSSMAMKYLVHRYNHLEEYADLDAVRELDKKFSTSNKPTGYGDHLTVRAIRQLAAKNTSLLPHALAFRQGLHETFRRGIGPEVRDINGEPYVALTRGLSSHIMNREAALTSAAYTPDTGFGDNMHHMWVPLKDVWYSFDLGPRYTNGNMGPEKEVLISHSGPRYEAEPHDIKPIRYRSRGKSFSEGGEVSSIPAKYYLDDAKDEDVGNYLNSIVFAPKADPHNVDTKAKVAEVLASPGVGPITKNILSKLTGENNFTSGVLDYFLSGTEQPTFAVKAIDNLKLPEKEVDDYILPKAANPAISLPNALRDLLSPNGLTRILDGIDLKLDDYNVMSSHQGRIQLYRISRAAKSDSKIQAAIWQKLKANSAESKKPEALYKTAESVWGYGGSIDKLDEDTVRDMSNTVMGQVVGDDLGRKNFLYDICQCPNTPVDVFDRLVLEFGIEYRNAKNSPNAILKMIQIGPKNNYSESVANNITRNTKLSDDFLSQLLEADLKPMFPYGNPAGIFIQRINRLGMSKDLQVKLVSKLAPSDYSDLASANNVAPEAMRVLLNKPSVFLNTQVLTENPATAMGNIYKADAMERLGRNKFFSLESLESLWPKDISFPDIKPIKNSTKISALDSPEYTWGDWGAAFGYEGAKLFLDKPYYKALASSIAKRRYFDDVMAGKDSQRAGHIILKWPEGLAKSENILQAMINEWLAKQKMVFKTNAFWHGTTLANAVQIIDDGVLHATPTDEILEGKAAWAVRAGSTDYMQRLLKWGRAKAQKQGFVTHEDVPAIVYFETDEAPKQSQSHSKQVYWTKDVSIKNTKLVELDDKDASHLRKEEIDIWLEPLVKASVPFEFPKLGIENRRQTKPLKTQTEFKTSVATLANAAARTGVGPNDNYQSFKPIANDVIRTNRGTTVESPDADPISSANVPNRTDKGFRSTMQHEDLHNLLGRVKRKYGEKARALLVTNIYHALPHESKKVLGAWADVNLHGNGMVRGSPDYVEESFAYLLNYLNDPSARAGAKEHFKLKDSGANAYGVAMKRAYRQLHAIAGAVDHHWLTVEKPWINAPMVANRIRPKGLDAVAAMQDSLAKAEDFDATIRKLTMDSNPVQDWEHDTALVMLGYRPEVDAALEAAKFLSGGKKDIDEVAFQLALRLFDGDYDRAALYAFSLPDNARNLKALKGLLAVGNFQKAEEPDMTIESIEPANKEAVITATKIRAAVETGSIRPLKLKGKHIKGAMAAKDPHSEEVYVLKPGSGKLSPGAGVNEETVSQSKRESAFWHCAEAMGLGQYIPRADLLKINGFEWAAIALVPFTYKTMDKLNRKAPGSAMGLLEPYRKSGVLHRWAVMDWVLGNVDSHGQNVLADPETGDIKLLDHGSAFAGKSFAPASDTKSFVPFYLRTWAPKDFIELKPEDRVKVMPTLDNQTEEVFGTWVKNINERVLAQILHEYGITVVDAVLGRLNDIKAHKGALSQYVNGLWAGLEDVLKD